MRKAGPTFMTLALSAAAVLGYFAYRWSAGTDNPPPASPTQAARDDSPAQLADSLPDFVLDNLDGNATGLNAWAGKPLVVNFWATWCGPCLREIPMLKTFQTDHPDVQVVGIAVDRLDPVLSFAADMEFNYPILVGQSDAMDAAASFGVDFFALPFTVFAAADGRLLGVHTGEVHQEHLDNLLAVLDDLDGARIDMPAARARIAGRM
jgi:thiol-disulfide isomerase/thioredoxin